jgi:site-specific recombinase XerD
MGQRGEAITSSGVWRKGNADLVTVADMLGHDNIITTARYTRSTEADQRAAVEKLAQSA